MDTQPLLSNSHNGTTPSSQLRHAPRQYGTVASSRPAPSSRPITTSFLIGNLHCPSCVSSIKDAVHDALGSDVLWVSPNIVTSVVTVQHKATSSGASNAISHMSKSLEDAGFEVTETNTDSSTVTVGRSPPRATNPKGNSLYETSEAVVSSSVHDGALDRLLDAPRRRRSSAAAALSRGRREAHLANCEECRLSRAPSPHERDRDTASKAGLAATQAAGANRLSPLESVVAGESGSFSTRSGSHSWRATLTVGGMTCTSCSRTIEEELKKRPAVSQVVVNLVNNSASVDVTDENEADALVEAIEDLGYDATLEDVVSLDEEPKVPKKPLAWRATLAVGGMTCASCVNSITAELDKKDWISNVAVNLVSNSATIDYTVKGKEKDIVDAIEDIGYEATIDGVQTLEREDTEAARERTVQILVDGLFCKHCPSRLIHSLTPFAPRLEILSEPTIEDPKIKIRYVPDTPNLTIRRILSAIEAADPSFHASIFHPPTLEERSKAVTAHHQRQLLRRVYLSLVVAIPTFVIGIAYMNIVSDDDPGKQYLMRPWVSGINRAQVALFILATPVYFFAADVFHLRAARELKNLWKPSSKTPILRRFYKFGSMNLLVSLGTTIAYISSLVQLVAAALSKPDHIEDSQFYFDSVVFLTLFLLLGRLIEAYSKSKTGDAVEMLGKLRPSTAILVEKDAHGHTSDSVVNMDLVEFGDTVRVQHGASPVSDGIVLDGESSFDESSLTGESRPIKKTVGDELYAGTVNKGPAVLMRVTGAAGRSMLDQIVQVVREGQTKRAPMERVADMLTAYFVPIITLFAVLTWVTWTVLGLTGTLPDHYLEGASGWFTFALQFAIAVFVVACPCGLGLAAPTAIFVGGGLAAKYGILAKGGGEAFEKASNIDVVVFDKTGTLTVGGDPKITDVETFTDILEDTASDDPAATLFAILKAVEENSSHPIAKAIVSYCSNQTGKQAAVVDVQELPGKGMKATYRGKDKDSTHAFDMIVGNEALMRDYSVPVSGRVSAYLDKWKREAKSVALAAVYRPTSTARSSEHHRWELVTALSISDPIRPEAITIVKDLHARGTRVWMLSGDNVVTAQAVASQVGIDPSNVLAEVLPSQKADKVKYLQSTLKAKTGRRAEEQSTRRATVAMVGDGINDAPALTRADVGIAIGSGSDVAISSADFVLVSSDLRAVVTLLGLSRAVFSRIRLNFAWAVIYNVLALPVAAGCLYPLTTASGQHIKLDPVWAALAMALSSISVVLSSLALRTNIPGIGFRGGRGHFDDPNVLASG